MSSRSLWGESLVRVGDFDVFFCCDSLVLFDVFISLMRDLFDIFLSVVRVGELFDVLFWEVVLTGIILEEIEEDKGSNWVTFFTSISSTFTLSFDVSFDVFSNQVSYDLNTLTPIALRRQIGVSFDFEFLRVPFTPV